MIGLGAVSAVVKGFFSSIWQSIRQWRIDREKDKVAQIKAENARLKARDKIRKELAIRDKKRSRSSNIDDALDRFE